MYIIRSIKFNYIKIVIILYFLETIYVGGVLEMSKKLKMVISALLSLCIAWQCQGIIGNVLYVWQNNLIISTVASLILFGVCYLLIGNILKLLERAIYSYSKILKRIEVTKFMLYFTSMSLALIISTLVSIPLSKIGIIGTTATAFLDIMFCYIGFVTAKIKETEILGIINNYRKGTKYNHNSNDRTYFEMQKSLKNILGNIEKSNKIKPVTKPTGIPKILDTSVIIDGRIYDLCKSGFIEGELVIPNVVLEELRHIADSSDTLKRNRGRRGLDVLKNIQSDAKVRIEEVKNMDGMEVDSILLKLAKELNAKVITNDYNLNKVAAVQKVDVLNINELANAIKPGEVMNVIVMKDGKENGQGIAYLEDGTMIVVEGGKGLIGKSQTVSVTSVLQTAAGRMIFAKPKEEEYVS
jgi:uncharacterized protein YacL